MADNKTSRLNRKINALLYKALSEGDDDKVCDMCQPLIDGPLHKLTIHGDTVIHVASYYKRNDLVLQLLSMLPEDQPDILTLKNEAGNTILHATATNNKTVKAAAEMLRRAPILLTKKDKLGETPLFRAARYGKTAIFNFLREEVSRRCPTEEELWVFLRNKKKATILHVAIHSENFELAYDIVRTYPMLIGEEDGDAMSGLQLLACKPSVFNHEFEEKFFKRFICKFIDLIIPKEKAINVPILNQRRKQKLKSEFANKLATILIESDASWEATGSLSNQNRIKLHKYAGGDSMSSENDPIDVIINAPTHHSPLILAIRLGSTEIVKKILECYPQAVEHIDEYGRSILHVAIKHRRKEIYELVVNMEYPMTRLRGNIDKEGNSILHMVAIKARAQTTEGDIRSPAIILRDDLILFEKVKSKCTTIATLQLNNDGVTAEQLFIQNNANLRVEAKAWMKSTAENCSVVAVLLSTVAFAAAYTVPGGPDQKTGQPLLKNNPFFIVFALSDALSLTFSLTSVIIFLSILTSSFRLKDFQNSLHNKLLLGLTMLILSVSMMMIAFAATLILTISSGKDWTNIMLYMISFFPVSVFMCSYVHLYKLLMKAFVERVQKVIDLIRPTRRDVEKSPQAKQISQAPTMTSFV